MQPLCSDFGLLESDIRRQPSLLAERLPSLRQAAAALCAHLTFPSRIYLVACGDGLSAALAAAFTWEQVLGIPVEAVPAMTFSRYRVESASPGSLVIVLSQSGKVVRVSEALAGALRRSLPALVVTNNPASPLAEMVTAECVFNLGFTRLGFTPGTSAYTYTLMALYELAAALSRSAALAQALQTQVEAALHLIAPAIESAWNPGHAFGRKLDKTHAIFTLGSGPAYGIAHYTMRKLFEICQCKPILLETEEYAHDAFYALEATTPAILFAPPDPGFQRCFEVARYLVEVGCPLAVVSNLERQDYFASPYVSFFGMPGASAIETSLTYAIAAQVLACQSGERLGGSFYACNDPARYVRGDAQIYESARMDSADG